MPTMVAVLDGKVREKLSAVLGALNPVNDIAMCRLLKAIEILAKGGKLVTLDSIVGQIPNNPVGLKYPVSTAAVRNVYGNLSSKCGLPSMSMQDFFDTWSEYYSGVKVVHANGPLLAHNPIVNTIRPDCPISLLTIKEVTAEHFRLKVLDIESHSSDSRIVHAKHVTAWLSSKVGGYSLTEVAKAFGRTVGFVTGAVITIEKKRASDPTFAKTLKLLAEEIAKPARVTVSELASVG